ncbi:MAG: hypothetical protein ACLP7I_12015 [Limisphaerales bacterium]
MTIKDAIILLFVVIVGVLIANLISLYIAAQQVQGTLATSSPVSLLTSLLASKTAAPASS